MRPTAGDEKGRGGYHPLASASPRMLKPTTRHSVMGRKEMTTAQQEANEAKRRR